MIENLHQQTGDVQRLVQSEPSRTDAFENTLRPQRLADYIGQQQLKRNLSVSLEAAKAR